MFFGVGPFAMEFWRPEAVAGRVNPNTQGFGAFCNEFCLHATCEHVHAALIALDQLSLQVPSFSDRKKQTPLFEQDPVQVILPSSLRELPQPNSEASSSARALSVPHEDRSLTRFLEAHAWGLGKHPCKSHSSLYNSWPHRLMLTFVSLLASCLLDLFQMQAAAQQWLQRQASASVPCLH